MAQPKHNNLNLLIENLMDKLKDCKDPRESIDLAHEISALYDRLPKENESLWTIEQASDWMGLKVDTLRKYCGSQKIPHLKIHGAVRFDPVSLKKWALSQMVAQHKAWR